MVPKLKRLNSALLTLSLPHLSKQQTPIHPTAQARNLLPIPPSGTSPNLSASPAHCTSNVHFTSICSPPFTSYNLLTEPAPTASFLSSPILYLPSPPIHELGGVTSHCKLSMTFHYALNKIQTFSRPPEPCIMI